MKPDQSALAITQSNQVQAELARQQLIKHCHALIAAIANRPGGTKLLQRIVPTLEMYASYKRGRRQRHRERG